MPTFAGVIAGSLFVAMGGLNVWIMLTNRGRSRHGRLWMRVHRIVGYLFIAIFAITLFMMLQRLRGDSEEIAPRILLHMSLALMLAPLLGVKVLLVRSQCSSHAMLCALGIVIFAISFTLVAINLAALALRNLNDAPVSISALAAFILIVLGATLTLLLRPSRLEEGRGQR